MKVSLLAVFAVAAGSLWGATCKFTDGAWDTPPSSAEDDIVIASGDLTWGATLPPKVKSWTQTGGTVTFQTVFGETGFTCFEVTGDVSLTGGTWTHTANSTTEKYRLNVACGGDFTIKSDAAIDVTARGYANAGPGRVDTHCGGGYGGQGTGYDKQPVTPCYGSITKPVNLGTSGRSSNHKGGGAVRLSVGGTLTVNGRIFAEGQTKTPLDAYYAGAGGSIWVTADALAGAGEISASAGRHSNNYYAGGGRVSLCLTGADKNFSDFIGQVYAYPSRNASLAVNAAAAGTVYYETAADGEGQGRLVIDRGSTSGTLAAAALTDIILDDQEEAFNPREVVLANGASVQVTSGMRTNLAIGEKLTFAGNGKFIVKGASLDLTTATIDKSGTAVALFQLLGGTIIADTFTIPDTVNVKVSDESSVDATLLKVANGGTLTVDMPLAVTGDMTVENGGKVTHSSNTRDTHYRLTLTVNGNLTVDAGGKIDVSNKGYTYQLGPGSSKSMYGSCHGGRSYYMAESQVDAAAVCYGSLIYPTDWGSGMKQSNQAYQSDGGGAAKLTVAGTLTVNGEIVAYGSQNVPYYNSAGGSVWIMAGSLVGTESSAVISASTGIRTNKYNYNLSGGGRVAIHLTNAGAGFDGYAGSITAYGTMMDTKNAFTAGGAGTVYLRTGDQAANEGTLIIDNGLPEGKTGGVTEISSSVLDTDVGSVVVRNGGRLKLLADQRLTVRGDWDVPPAAFSCEANGGLVFAGSGTSHVYGNLTVSAFICQTPGKEIVFGDGTTLTITAGGRLQLEGEDEHAVVLRSETAETPWLLAVDATAAQSVGQVSVSDCDASGGTKITAVNSTLTRTENWKDTTVVVGQTVTWTGGAGSGVWMATGNWDVERAPLATDRVVIAPAAFSPVLSDDFTALDLTVQEGAALDLGTRTFTIIGDLTVSGVVTAVRGGKLVANGSADFTGATIATQWLALELAGDGKAVQPLAGGGCAFDSVTILPNAAGVTVSEGFATRRLNCETDAAFALSFAPGVTVEVGAKLTLKGPIALASTTAGEAWAMVVTGVRDVCDITVYDCSTDIVGSPVVWTGKVDSDFAKAGNWSTDTVPGEDDDVIIGAGTVKASAAIAVGSLWLKNGAEVTIDKGGSTVRTVYLDSGATLTHSANAKEEKNRLVLDIGGNLVLEEFAAIDVTGKGYQLGSSAPGVPAPANSGGNYAGRSETHTALENIEGRTYGSFLAPTDLGAGGVNTAGGGAILLTVAGEALVDGKMLSTGQKAGSFFPGSGGTVSLTAFALRGTGVIAADGGEFNDNYAASGGRIAVKLMGPDLSFADFDGKVHAYSSTLASAIVPYTRGSAGTIYIETAADGEGRGQVVIDNSATGTEGGGAGGEFGKARTDYPAQKRSPGRSEAKQATFVLRNTVGLNITADAKIGNIVVEGTKPKVYLNGHTLKINTDRPADWPKDGTLPSFVVPGVDAEGNPGKVIWKQGLTLIVR